MPISNLQRLILNSNKKEESVADSFVSDFKYVISRYESEHQEKPSPTYKPSSMRCIRNMYFQRTGQDIDEYKINPSLVAIGESGTDRHKSIQHWVMRMKDYGVDCEWVDVVDYLTQENLLDNFEVLNKGKYETKLEHKYLHIRFLCDGIIKYKNEYYILEIKTETSVKWQSRREINEEHIEQGVAYSTLLHIDNVLFLYENRDFCDWKSFILNVSDTMKMEYILNPINSCERYIKSNKVPPIPAVAGTKYCRYCLYKNACKVIGQTEDISNQHEEHLND